MPKSTQEQMTVKSEKNKKHDGATSTRQMAPRRDIDRRTRYIIKPIKKPNAGGTTK